MNIRSLLIILSFCLIQHSEAQETTSFKIITVAFYNLENLFDYEDDPITFDDDRTPEGKDHWTETIYRAKIKNMAGVLAQIGTERAAAPPVIIGVCEIENRRVLEDLLNEESLQEYEYGIIHEDSPDRRGIDVALLYRKRLFTPTHSLAAELVLHDRKDSSRRIYTRDQLVVSGMLDGERIHFIVCHWPSRSGGKAGSNYKRIKAAKLTRRLADSIFSLEPYASIITMGDFNDDPTDSSIKKVLNARNISEEIVPKSLYNPMYRIFKRGIGSLAWRDGWNLFDQLIISSELLKNDYERYRFYRAGIYNRAFLQTPTGRYKGYPYRSFSNGTFTGGYSDHFPVYIYLIKRSN